MYFYLWWGLSAVALVSLAGWMGKRTEYGRLGILIDHRGRFSLTHFQIVLWTIVILSSAIGALFASGFDPTSFELTPQLLGLMGISGGSAVFSTAVKAGKDQSAKFIACEGASITNKDGTTSTVKPHFSQIWLEEEGENADKVINITKFQNFVFTLIILGFYIVIAYRDIGLPMMLPENVEWLIGISHAGYVGGKMPERK